MTCESLRITVAFLNQISVQRTQLCGFVTLSCKLVNIFLQRFNFGARIGFFFFGRILCKLIYIPGGGALATYSPTVLRLRMTSET
jgi:hypothetical protein